ncbi:hypothetical protein SHJG_p1061 (plasmid) [Streptomyces hygroscopicus subsp. jinggangensis 5008]|nr:hypothetical protein SHJG_p1061 [Streptomyces hygroscopicus subsp. jinggangensis 5008]AGF68346.1 hypothetical protein SHJGH_p1061 [Streptomyces hygroscopicus subsp. jinggangensis TL01]
MPHLDLVDLHLEQVLPAVRGDGPGSALEGWAASARARRGCR